tara:strand:- start:1983 stop:2858 length:876 start_codon:yes stop_codon:yes gene_type:complete
MKTITKAFENSSIDWFQLIKLVVYSLLLLNFALYVRNDVVIAAHTLRNGGSLIDWTRSFATTMDESAWIILIILLELETYVLSDKALTRKKMIFMQSARFICYGVLAHTLYAYGIYVYQLSGVTLIGNVSNLCQLAGTDVSFATNLLYTVLDASNCQNLSNGSQFYYTDPPNFIIVTDSAGLIIERQLAWVDLLEAISWLLILLTIEIMVRLQDRDISEGPVISGLNAAKVILYSLLWGAIAYWVYRGHLMFAWDEFVWIAGFVLIEMNIAERRNEFIEDDQTERLAAREA